MIFYILYNLIGYLYDVIFFFIFILVNITYHQLFLKFMGLIKKRIKKIHKRRIAIAVFHNYNDGLLILTEYKLSSTQPCFGFTFINIYSSGHSQPYFLKVHESS